VPVARERDLPGVILFDMDDTIFDHSLTCRAAIARLRREHGFLRRRPLAELWNEYQRLLGLTHPDVALGRRAPDDARAERWQKVALRCGTTLTLTEARHLSQEYRGFYQSLRRPIAGAPRLLERLHRRTRIGVVSNNEVAEQEEKIRYLGIGRWIDLLVVSGEVGVTKPDPVIFRTALERADVEPADAVMVGDSWENDVLGALGAGIRPVWFNRFRLPRPDPTPVAELESLRSFPAVERALRSPTTGRVRPGPPRSARAL